MQANETDIEALYHALRQRDPTSWESAWHCWQGRVAAWVRRHPQFRYTGEETAYFVNRAFERLWRAVDAEKLERFANPAQLVQYLKLCVHSVILDELRGPGPEQQVAASSMEEMGELPSSEPDAAEAALHKVRREELWAAVAVHIRSDEDRVLVEAGLVRGLPPRVIAGRYPALFSNVQDVYRIKRNLLERLGRDQRLREFLG